METDFGVIMEKISDWENRERDRHREQSRWTKDDERKYRGTINKLLVLNRRKIRDVRTCQSIVRSLKGSLDTIQKQIQNEIERQKNESERQGNRNIRYFTYATVFFLPLGFATSIFGMQATPPNDVLNSMIICAAVAFIVTIIFLLSIQHVWKLSQDVFVIMVQPILLSLSVSSFLEDVKIWLSREQLTRTWHHFTRNNIESNPQTGDQEQV
ncbi:MAG: hypothetical protein M1834_006912 [Cirrosporium novae-zelandiae]|nr:MAG: hypothetical protein M1834_006912 [Cirrosporium novae-zelandiae]